MFNLDANCILGQSGVMMAAKRGGTTSDCSELAQFYAVTDVPSIFYMYCYFVPGTVSDANVPARS